MTDDAANPAFSSSIGTEFLISVSLWTSGQRSRCQSYDILQASPDENATQDAQNHTILWGKFLKKWQWGVASFKTLSRARHFMKNNKHFWKEGMTPPKILSLVGRDTPPAPILHRSSP